MMHETDATSPAVTDIGAFCRAVEAHLCRVNGGHLVRIVGPAFELVAGWAKEGMPLRIVLHGVDRTVARLTAKGPRRRPVRIEFCEADVRDAADQWRRAVGVHAATSMARPRRHRPTSRPSRLPSLPKHLERVLVRLSAVTATSALPPALSEAVVATIRVVDACLDASRGARGEARTAIIERLVDDRAHAHAGREVEPSGGAAPGTDRTGPDRALTLSGTDASRCLPRCRGRPLR